MSSVPALTPEERAANQGPQIIAIISVMTGLATVAVILRLISRRLISAPLWWDDYVILLALLFNFGSFANVLTSVFFGLGKHVAVVPPAHTVIYLQLVYAYEIQYTILIMTIKLSILFMYHRIFATPGFRLGLKFLFAAVVLWGFGTTMSAIFECTPPSHLWDTTSPGTCVNLVNLFIATAAINIATDIVMVIAPMPLVWKLQIPTGQKIALCGIFALASFVCIASIVRISILDQVDFTDPTYDTILSEIWSIVEPCCGITSACLPSMRPLYNRIRGKPNHSRSRSGASGGAYGSYTGAMGSKNSAGRGLSASHGRNFSRMEDDGEPVIPGPVFLAGANESQTSHETGVDEPVRLETLNSGPPRQQIWKTVDIEMGSESTRPGV